MMKNPSFTGSLLACVIAFFALPASAVTIDYSNISGSSVRFDPTDLCGGGTVGCFDFTPAPNIEITSGSASGSSGTIGGVFGVGNITSLGGFETANVSGTGTLTITDVTGTLTADLTWIDIATFGTAGSINTQGNANLTNFSYTGTDADLSALASSPAGIQTATFQFTGVTSLTQLFTTNSGTTQTSFSGSITAVPIPPAVWLFGSGLLGLVGVARRRS